MFGWLLCKKGDGIVGKKKVHRVIGRRRPGPGEVAVKVSFRGCSAGDIALWLAAFDRAMEQGIAGGSFVPAAELLQAVKRC